MERKKKRFMPIILIMLILASIVIFTKTVLLNESIPKQEILIDVNQFSRISSEELIEIMGKPISKEDWNNTTSKGKFPITNYYYDNYEFLVADNSVVRMNIHSEKYNNKDGESIKFSSEESILEMINIDIDYNRIKKIADTGVALRFSPVSDKVADVWCTLMNKKEKTIDEIKVTFDLNYFE